MSVLNQNHILNYLILILPPALLNILNEKLDSHCVKQSFTGFLSIFTFYLGIL